jgi:hypothetical protein
MLPTLGTLKQINLRQAWKNEALDFTPWLAQETNLQTLADALGLIELELVQTEYQVGDFKLDILCSDDEGEIIIENQLERTNHSHLCQTALKSFHSTLEKSVEKFPVKLRDF